MADGKDSITSLVAAIQAGIDGASNGVKRYKLRTVLKMAGYTRRGSRNIAEIQSALRTAGIQAHPPLSEVESLDNMVGFAYHPDRKATVSSLDELRSAEPPLSAAPPKSASRTPRAPSEPSAATPTPPANKLARGCLWLLGLTFLCSLLSTNPAAFWLIAIGSLAWWAHRHGWLRMPSLDSWSDTGPALRWTLGITAGLIVLAIAGLSGGDPSQPTSRESEPLRQQQLVDPPDDQDAPPEASQTPLAPTEEDEPTPRPSDTAAPNTPTPVPPTASPIPPTQPPPTQAPPFDLDPGPDQNCDRFPSYDTMQAWRGYWIARGIANPGRLDGDGDGVACEEGEGGRPAAPPPPPPPVSAPQPVEPAPRNCCKYCTPGRSKPCGDSCISINYNCHKGAGCACMGGG